MVSRIYRALSPWVIERIGLLKFRGRVLIGTAVGPKYYEASNCLLYTSDDADEF